MAEFGNLGTASFRITAVIEDALTKIEKVSKTVQGLGNTITAVSGVLRDVAVSAGMLGAAISVPMVKLTKTGMDFEKTMSAVKAVVADLRIGTTEAGERLANLGELAKKLGADTMFSAKQVAEAMHFLGVAGFTSKEIFEGVNATLSLAAAGMLDLDVAASIAADTMIAFGISATQIGRIADDFAAVASSTNTTIQLLGESMKYVSPIASTLGQSIEEVVLALGLLARAGLKGSIAGASLSQVLSQLAGKSDQLNEKLAKYGLTFADVNPEVVKLTDIIRIFRIVGLQTTDAMELFMVRAGRALTTMMNAGEAATLKLANVIQGSFGAALIQAGIRVKNVAGTWEQFQGAIESLSITLFQQMNTELNETLNRFIDILVQVRFWVEENDVLMRQLLKITAYVGGIAIALSAVAIPLAVITGSFGFVITQLGILGGMLGGIPGVIGGAIVSIFTLSKGFGVATGSAVGFGTAVKVLDGRLKSFIVGGLKPFWNALKESTAYLLRFAWAFYALPADAVKMQLIRLGAMFTSLGGYISYATQMAMAYAQILIGTVITALISTTEATWALVRAQAALIWSKFTGDAKTFGEALRYIGTQIKALANALTVGVFTMISSSIAGAIKSIIEFGKHFKSLKDIKILLSSIGGGILAFFSGLVGHLLKGGKAVYIFITSSEGLKATLLSLQSAWGTAVTAVIGFMTTIGGVPGLIGVLIGAAVFGGLIAVLITLKQNWDYVVQAFQAAYNTTLKPVIEGFAAAVIWMWENAIKPTWDVLVVSVQRLLESFKSLFISLEPLKVVFQGLGLVIGGVLAGALVVVVGLLVGLTEIFNGIVKAVTWVVDVIIEGGRAIGLLSEETKTSTERLDAYTEAAKKAAVESKNLLESTRELDTARKKDIGSERELVNLLEQQAKGANTLTKTEEMINRLRATGAKSVKGFAEATKLRIAGLKGELEIYKKSLAALKAGPVTDENKKTIADLENQIMMLDDQLKTNNQTYIDAYKILKEYNGGKDITIEQYEKEYEHLKALTDETNAYDKARLDSIEHEKEIANIKDNLQLKYLEGTERELAQIKKIKTERLALIDVVILDYKMQIEALSNLINLKQEDIAAGKVAKHEMVGTLELQRRKLNEIARLTELIDDVTKNRVIYEKDAEKDISRTLKKEGETRKKYFLELQKIEAERAKDFLRVAEIEKQILKDNNAEKWKELRITEEDAKKSKEVAAQRIEALRLEAEQMVAIDAKAQEEILKEHERVEKEKEKLEKEREKKLKTLDATATLEQKATDQVAKQVRSVQDLFVLYNALYLIRLRQEQLAFRAAERALEAQQKLRKAQEQAAKQPENKSLAIKIEKLELTAKLWGAVATKMTNAAGIPIFDDIQVISANNVSIAGGIKPVAGAGVGGVGGGVGGKGGVGAGGVGGGTGGDTGIGGASLGVATVNGSPVYVNGSPVYVSGKLITDIAGAVRGTVGGGVGGLAGGGAGGDLTPRSGITPRGGVVPRSGIVPEHPVIPRGAVIPVAPAEEVKGAYTTDIESFAKAVKELKEAIDKEYRARGEARRISLKEAADRLTLKRIETGKDDTGRLHRTFGSLIKEILEAFKLDLDKKAGKVSEKAAGVARPAVVDRDMDTKVGDHLIKMLDRAEAMRIKSEASLLKVGVRALDSLISKGLIPKETRAWFVESLRAEVKERVKLREEERKRKIADAKLDVEGRKLEEEKLKKLVDVLGSTADEVMAANLAIKTAASEVEFAKARLATAAPETRGKRVEEVNVAEENLKKAEIALDNLANKFNADLKGATDTYNKFNAELSNTKEALSAPDIEEANKNLADAKERLTAAYGVVEKLTGVEKLTADLGEAKNGLVELDAEIINVTNQIKEHDKGLEELSLGYKDLSANEEILKRQVKLLEDAGIPITELATLGIDYKKLLGYEEKEGSIRKDLAVDTINMMVKLNEKLKMLQAEREKFTADIPGASDAVKKHANAIKELEEKIKPFAERYKVAVDVMSKLDKPSPDAPKVSNEETANIARRALEEYSYVGNKLNELMAEENAERKLYTAALEKEKDVYSNATDAQQRLLVAQDNYRKAQNDIRLAELAKESRSLVDITNDLRIAEEELAFARANAGKADAAKYKAVIELIDKGITGKPATEEKPVSSERETAFSRWKAEEAAKAVKPEPDIEEATKKLADARKELISVEEQRAIEIVKKLVDLEKKRVIAEKISDKSRALSKELYKVFEELRDKNAPKAEQDEAYNKHLDAAKIANEDVKEYNNLIDEKDRFNTWKAEEAAKAVKPELDKPEVAKHEGDKPKPESALERWQARMRADEGKEKPKTAFEIYQEKKYGKDPEVPEFDAGKLGADKPEVKNEYDSLLKELLAFFRKNNAPGEKEVSEVDVSSIVQTKMETANKIASKLHKPEATLTDVVNTLKEEFSNFDIPFKDYKSNVEQRNEWLGAPASDGSSGTVKPTSSGVEGSTTTTTVDSLIDEDLLTQKVNSAGEVIRGLSDFVLAEFEEIKEEFRIAPFKWADVFVEHWREQSKRMMGPVNEFVADMKYAFDPDTHASPSFRDIIKSRSDVLQRGLMEMNSMVKKNLPNLHEMNFGNVTVPKPKPISTAGMSTTQNINQLNDHRSVAMTVNSNMDVVNMQRHIGSALARAAMNVGQI